MGKPGRRPKLSPEIIIELERLLKLGLSRTRACVAVGISQDSLLRWCKADSELKTLLEKAEVRGEIEHLENIRAIAIGEKRGDYRASAWFLGRKFPNEWSDKAASQAQAQAESEIALSIIKPRDLDATDIARSLILARKPISEWTDEELDAESKRLDKLQFQVAKKSISEMTATERAERKEYLQSILAQQKIK